MGSVCYLSFFSSVIFWQWIVSWYTLMYNVLQHVSVENLSNITNWEWPTNVDIGNLLSVLISFIWWNFTLMLTLVCYYCHFKNTGLCFVILMTLVDYIVLQLFWIFKILHIFLFNISYFFVFLIHINA
jgi:hypothetical protein